MVTATTTQAPPTCDAHATGRAATDWGFVSLPCQTRVGLRSFFDQRGVVRYYCAAPEHKANVERRFGVAPVDHDEDHDLAERFETTCPACVRAMDRAQMAEA